VQSSSDDSVQQQNQVMVSDRNIYGDAGTVSEDENQINENESDIELDDQF